MEGLKLIKIAEKFEPSIYDNKPVVCEYIKENRITIVLQNGIEIVMSEEEFKKICSKYATVDLYIKYDFGDEFNFKDSLETIVSFTYDSYGLFAVFNSGRMLNIEELYKYR